MLASKRQDENMTHIVNHVQARHDPDGSQLARSMHIDLRRLHAPKTPSRLYMAFLMSFVDGCKQDACWPQAFAWNTASRMCMSIMHDIR